LKKTIDIYKSIGQIRTIKKRQNRETEKLGTRATPRYEKVAILERVKNGT